MKPFPSRLVPEEAEAWEDAGTKPWVLGRSHSTRVLFTSQWGIPHPTIPKLIFEAFEPVIERSG